jgi:small subunit ribosomal protein S6
MREYEAMLVLQPGLDDEGINGLVTQVGDLVSRGGGTVASSGQLVDKRGNVAAVSEGWKTRRLAYTIGGQREGYFVVLRFEAPAEALDELERSLKINDNVLRHMVLRMDEA